MSEIELIVRNELFPHWIVYVLLFSIVVLSLIKYQREVVFTNLKTTFFKPPSAIPFSKGEVSFFGATNWALLINYVIVSALAVYMVLIYLEKSDYWLMFLPAAYYLFHISVLFFAGILSGELKVLRDNILLLNFTSHSIGIAFIPILLTWILNPNLSSYMIDVLMIVFLILHFIRIIRGVFLGLRNKVLWYYIILYLCGLEIWPVLVVYLLVSPGFIE
jgi:hypothetical protein